MTTDEEFVKRFADKCIEITKEPKIRFAGIVNSSGELITGGFKDGLTPYEQDDNRHKLYRELAARITLRKNFDYKLGRVKYSASRREKIVMMSFPLDEYVLLITAEPDINIDRTAYGIIRILGQEWYTFFGN